MSATGLERREELACDAALVGLDDAERAELEALGVSQTELLALELAAGEIAAAALGAVVADSPLVTAMPAALADRVVARLARTPGSAPVPPARLASGRPERGPERASTPRWMPWAFAAAATVLAVIGWSRTPKESPDATSTRPPPSATTPPGPSAEREAVAAADAGGATGHVEDERAALLARADTAHLPWKATKDEAARNASGEVVWNDALQRGFMRFRGLSANDPEKNQYQLWIFDAERDQAYPVDGGVFDVGPDGEVVVPITAKLRVAKPKLFAITVEKPGGVVVSKRERIVLTAAPSG